MISDRIRIVPAERGHVVELAERLRAKDKAEIEAAGVGANRALWRSYRQSLFAKTMFVDGELAAVWGLGGVALGAVGRPWLLTAPPVERVPVSAVRVMRDEISLMLSTTRRLVGFVDDSYERAVRLLVMVGFQLSEPFPFGPWGMPFRQYEMERN